MNEHEIEVARALVASPNFAWQPAMRDTLGRRVLEISMDPTPTVWVRSDSHGWLTEDLFNAPLLPEGGFTQALPDLTDDGTRGALEGLACRLWGAPLAQVSPAPAPALDDGFFWVFYPNRPGPPESAFIGGVTKGEAWARAVVCAKVNGG